MWNLGDEQKYHKRNKQFQTKIDRESSKYIKYILA